MLVLPSRVTLKKRVRQGAIFALIAILGITLLQPSEVMALFNWNNPTEVQRQDVAPLDSPYNAPNALPKVTGLSQEVKESDKPRERVKELTEKRTAFTKTFLNADGTRTLEYTPHEQNYKEDGIWKHIDNTVREVDGTDVFKGKAGAISALMKPLGDGITFTMEDKDIILKPNGVNDVKPLKRDDNSVVYKDAWPGVDIEYELRGQMVKEVIVVKSKEAQTSFDFAVNGGKVIAHPSRTGELAIEDLSDDYSFSPLSLDVNGRGVISEQRVSQAPTTSGLKISVDKEWFDAQTDDAFPMRIDPTITKQSSITYKMFKSDGYSCNASTCYANTGSIDDGGFKHWRTLINIPYTELTNKTVLDADLHGYYKTGVGGNTTERIIGMSVATCSTSFSCYGSTAMSDGAVTQDFDIDFTAKLKAQVDADDYSTWWGIKGVESSSTTTYKPYYDMKATIDYDTPTPISVPASPVNGATVVTTQPSLRVNAATDADGDDVKYYFRVATNSDAETGAVINSGWIDSSQWTVPDNILQDGRTYYWHVYTKGYAQRNPNWVRSFKVDMRTGKDSTQAYEEVGPVSVDLATGNATTGTGSHSISALGGDIGVSLNYNSPAMSNPGLIAQYWNNTTFSGTPALTRIDPDLNFTWADGSPSAGIINVDNFSSRWQGYITAPTTGDYTFGCTADSWCKIYFDDQLYHAPPTVGTSFGAAPLHMEAGKPVKIKVEQAEGSNTATMQLLVKGAVTQQVVPAVWLETGAQQTASKYGLEGRYYNDPTAARTFPSDPNDPNRLLMVRRDPKLTFNWDTGVPSPGLPADNFLVRWKGYVTVPTSGSYNIGGNGAVGMRVKTGTGIGGIDQTVLDSWTGVTGDRWGSAVNLTAGQPVPITVEIFDGSGSADFKLIMKSSSLPAQEMPVTWLAPNANVLPDGWELGYGDGDVNYERLHATSSAAVLSDSTGQTYEYAYKNGVYVPPANQEAVLTRNDDGTHTVLDTDGKTYIFDVEGKLKSVSAPEDDRQPATLKYEYGSNPSRLTKIVDGVNSARYGTLHYSGDSECQTLSGFDNAPSGMLCAFKTTDGKKTLFQYKSENLARIIRPGDDFEDYGYDSYGRITIFRDSLANDAIAYGVRTDSSEVTNEVTYDGLGRVIGVKEVAPTPGANRVESTLDYLQSSTEFHITSASEPHGFTRKVTYDSLFRTVAETDLSNLTTTTQWHDDKDLVLSTTDPTGLKGTTIYDENDLPIDSYGPAPASWFGLDNRPLADKLTSVPHTKTGYDEGIEGLSLSVYDNSKLLHEPKRVTTGMNDASEAKYILDLTNTDVAPTDGLSARAVGKIRLSSIGDYNFRLWHSGGVRLYVDKQLLIDDWADGSERSSPTMTFHNSTADRLVPIVIEFYKKGTSGTGNGGRLVAKLYQTAPGGTETAQIVSKLTPNYGLATSTTAYDDQLGNLTSTVQYSKPEYGLVSSTTLDPTGLNLQNSAEHETPGSGFLRQTSRTLPGGTQTQYLFYSATDTRDNPCTQETESYIQAGFAKGKEEQDPDGAGAAASRVSETIYDNSGQIIATRFNNEAWTCNTFDDRGRPLTSEIPAINGKPGRTITNNYLVGSSPLKTSVSDGSGTVTTETDLLGRTSSYKDAQDNTTTYIYDSFGRITTKNSPVGNETFTYDQYDRLTTYKLDGVTFATVHYDQYDRISSVDYPAGLSLASLQRDNLGRVSGVSYQIGGSNTLSDEVVRSTSGNILTGTENGIQKSYTYDSVGRLINASIGNDSFSYAFDTPDSSCSTVAGNNLNTAKNSNRTSYTYNGETTTYCYDMADRLRTSSDERFTDVQYDTRGNTTSLGDSSHKTEFDFDSSDRNISIAEAYTGQSEKEVVYTRDVSDRLLRRQYKVDGLTKSDTFYGYTSAGDSPSFVRDTAGTIVQKYLTLPGGINVTIKPQSTSAGAVTYSLTNLHGDTMATVNSDGLATPVVPMGPYGELLEGSPVNTVEGASFAYVGRFKKTTDTTFAVAPTQMGARVYIAELGRFLQVDPIEGGTDNNYVYVADPVNEYDLNGENWLKMVFQAAKPYLKEFAKRVVKPALNTIGKAFSRSKPARPSIPSVPVRSAPKHVQSALGHLKSTNFKRVPKNVKSKRYENDPAAHGGGTKLPVKNSLGQKITYREFDVRPSVKGVGRGKERLVVGSDKSVYYTRDHYGTFVQLEKADPFSLPLW